MGILVCFLTAFDVFADLVERTNSMDNSLSSLSSEVDDSEMEPAAGFTLCPDFALASTTALILTFNLMNQHSH